jgi:hypothetical protein
MAADKFTLKLWQEKWHCSVVMPDGSHAEIPSETDLTGTEWQKKIEDVWAASQVIVRMIAYTDGLAAVDVDTVWAVADYQDQIAEIYNKLPTKYIMLTILWVAAVKLVKTENLTL